MGISFLFEKRILGGILLVAGCCVGAGMLGLPVLSAQAGFYPSLFILALCWLFMLSTGLLLLEVNLCCGREANLITMAGATLGTRGKGVAWALFLFLFYSLMVAYVAASSVLTNGFLAHVTGWEETGWTGEFLLFLAFAFLLYSGTGAVDRCNRLLMIGLIATYSFLVVLGAPHVDVTLLQRREWGAVTLAIPVVLTSFGFHNLVPSLVSYFKGDAHSLKKVLLVGSAIPFAIYLVWEWLILGIVPPEGFQVALQQGEIATEALRRASGSSWVSVAAQGFAFFAILTSFLSVALSFVDFLSDGLGIDKSPLGKGFLAFLVLAPPFLCASLYPHIFLLALNLAGGVGAVILFGVLPALMVWQGRYVQKWEGKPLIKGGKPFLIAILSFSIWVLFLQVRSIGLCTS